MSEPRAIVGPAPSRAGGKGWTGAVRRGLASVVAQDSRPGDDGGEVGVPPGYALVPEGYKLVPLPLRGGGAPPRPGQRRPPPPPPGSAPGSRPQRPAGPGALGARVAVKAVARRPLGLAAGTPPKTTPQSRAYVTSTAITILGALLLTFALDALLASSIRHARSQSVAFSQLRADLANGMTPVGQTTATGHPLPLGTPLGIIDIPWLNLREVYFEGTSGTVLESGAGHRRDSPMPGQPGNAVIFGRQTSFGGPFGALELLSAGSQFTITSGQGTSRWRVIAIRKAGDPQPDPLVNGAARVTLVTATGPPFAPDGVLRVDADLITGVDSTGAPVTAFQGAAQVFTAGQLAPSEKILAGDAVAWRHILQLLLILLPVAVAIGWARHEWGRWQAWVSGTPLLLAVGLAISDQVLCLLPNVL